MERTPSGRVRRTSAQVAVFHLQEIAEDELARDWTKRRMKDDLVPETARVSCPPSIVDSAVASGRDMPWPEPWDSRPVTWATRCPRHLWRVLPAAKASVLRAAGVSPGLRLTLVLSNSQLNYTRPGLPTLNPQLLEAWKNEVKEKGHVNCPNDVSRGRRVGAWGPTQGQSPGVALRAGVEAESFQEVPRPPQALHAQPARFPGLTPPHLSQRGLRDPLG